MDQFTVAIQTLLPFAVDTSVKIFLAQIYDRLQSPELCLIVRATVHIFSQGNFHKWSSIHKNFLFS